MLERRRGDMHEPMDSRATNDREPFITPGSVPTEQSTPVFLLSDQLYSEMSLPVLAAHCVRELNTYRRGEPCTERYGVELIHRATVQGDQEAWAWVQYCFEGVLLNWLRCHPQRAQACRLESEENYVAQAFERFWQVTASHKWVEFHTLAAALRYLRASLNGAILETLRVSERPGTISNPWPDEEDRSVRSEVWVRLQSRLSNRREQRLAYLLYHCGLEPAEIVQCCPQEWSDAHEAVRLRRTIFMQLTKRSEL
jgi:hypothetical protein